MRQASKEGINAVDSHGMTAMNWCCKLGNVE
jgi:hypothetical protein